MGYLRDVDMYVDAHMPTDTHNNTLQRWEPSWPCLGVVTCAYKQRGTRDERDEDVQVPVFVM